MAAPGAPARYRVADVYLPEAFRATGAEIVDDTFPLTIVDDVTEYPPMQLWGVNTAGQLLPCDIAATDGSQQPIAVSLWAISLPNRVAAGQAVGSIQNVKLRTRGRFDLRGLAYANPNMGATPEIAYQNILTLGRAAGIFANLTTFSDVADTVITAQVNPGYRVNVDYADAGLVTVYNFGDGGNYPVVLAQADYNALKALGVVA